MRSLTRSRRVAATATAIVIATAAAPTDAAAAPTLNADMPCYNEQMPVLLSGGGYTPGGRVQMAFGIRGEHGPGQVLFAEKPTLVDAAGSIFDRFPGSSLLSDDVRAAEVTVTATDEQRVSDNAPPEEQFAVASFQVRVFDVALVTPRIRPAGRWTVDATGFVGSRRLWMHYVFRGRRRATVPLGRTTGPCGDLRRTMRQFPMGRPEPGRWEIFVSDHPRRYDEAASWVRVPIRVPRGR